MFFDIGWPELMLIGIIALVVIGPKDLPRAMRVAGYWIRKARTLSREFQNSVDQMIREAELEEMREELKKATEFDLEGEFKKTVDPTGELAETLKPPGLPDYFEEAPKTVEAAAPEAEAEQPELPFFDQPTAPAPAAPAEGAPAGEALPASPSEHSAEAPASAHETATPKP